MRELIRTNDPTMIAFATALLRGEDIDFFEMDVHLSVLEGSIGILPSRIMVRDEDLYRAAAVFELGCGVGAASLCLMARVPDLAVSAVELQPAYAALAQDNAARNRIPFEVVTGDIRDLPIPLRDRTFDHVITNPPYYLRDGGSPAKDAGRERSLGEEVPLSHWVDTGLRRLRPGGTLTVIQRADRLGDLLGAIGQRAGRVTLYPLAPRAGRDATRVILTAQKGGKTPLRLCEPTVLHQGAAHDGDRDSYTAAAAAVLRDGAPWPWCAS